MTPEEASDRNDQSGGTATSGVVDALSEMIQGKLSPGASLPSEAELAARFSVSRLTVREAVKMLAGRGLLDVARGRRAVVREPDGTAFSDFLVSLIQRDPKGLFDLIELRKSLEVQSAGLAAKRVSRAGLVALETALQGMRDAADAGGDHAAAESVFHRWDVGFHEALATASGNRVLSYLLEAMAVPLRESFQLSRRGHEQRGLTVDDTIAAHAAILEGVRAGKARAAADAMRAHLEDTERDIRVGLGSRLLR
jgi:GntR family transcriptional repressor for pyruvate dehydrogenase complex